jgi:hypothetical protein
MRSSPRKAYAYFLLYLVVLLVGGGSLLAQSSGSIAGNVVDSTGASIPDASVTLRNAVSGLNRQIKTDASGHFQFGNLPLSAYNLSVASAGFTTAQLPVEVHSVVVVTVPVTLQVSGGGTVVDVEADPSVSSDASMLTDIDRATIDKLPLESQSSGLSSIITLSSPGVAADSNGQIHSLGDHASNTFSVDGENISDQQSKVFSNQLPSNAVQSLQVIAGAPPAEYGGKTSMIIEVTTRSGQGVKTPTGSVTASYGSFGSANGSVDLSYGGDRWGNFIEVDGLNSGRFLDPPESAVFHDKGNELNLFDRIDRQLTKLDAVRLNVNVSRSWFQTPNTYDNLGVQNVVSGGTGANPVFATVGNTDQRSKILTYNIAPTYTRTVSDFSVFNSGAFVRRDGYNYYPSNNPLSDLGPIQSESISQARSLLDGGLHSDYSYVRGINNIKVGAQYTQTFLREQDNLGIVNATYNSPCVSATGASQPGFTSLGQCSNAGLFANSSVAGGTFNPVLEPYDLTRGGTLYHFEGHTDVKELALYAQDQIKAAAGRTSLGHLVYREEDGNRVANIIRADAGITVQREPGAFKPGLRQPGACASPDVHSWGFDDARAGLPQ